MPEKEKKKLLEMVINISENLTEVGLRTRDKDFFDLGLTFKLVLVLASQGNLNELKAFLKNYMLIGEEEKESAISKISKMSVCIN